MGARLGRYVLLKHLASGGMANVLLARSDGIEGFERHVVIKRIRPEMARDQRFIKMFLDEARVAATLHHQNIVQVHDIGEADGEYFIAMEYVHGEDARKLLSNAAKQRTHVPLRYALAIVSAAASALHSAHEQPGSDRRPLNIVHRDVSPSNIRVGYDGSIKLLDFGIATASSLQETHSGSLKGKLAYMSPEQCKGAPVDRRTDIYALGAVLYELATTSRMIRGQNDYQVMEQVVQGRITPPQNRRAELPKELTDLIMRALATDRDARHATAEEFRVAVDQFATNTGLTASSAQLAAYMHKQFGKVPEPWLTLEDQSGVSLDDAPSAVYGSTTSNWGDLNGSDAINTGSIPPRTGRLTETGIHGSGIDASGLHGSGIQGSGVHTVAIAEAHSTPRPRPEPAPAAEKMVWNYQPESEPAPTSRFALWKIALITAAPVVAALIWLVSSAPSTTGPVATMTPPPLLDVSAPATSWQPPAAAAPQTVPDAGASDGRVTVAPEHAGDPAANRRARTVASRPVEAPRAKQERNSHVDAAVGDLGDPVGDLGDPVTTPPVLAPAPAPTPVPLPVPAPAVAAPAPVAPVTPQLVTPSSLEGYRLAGDRTIVPDPTTRDAIGRAREEKVTGAFKMCVTAEGAIDTVTPIKGTGYPAYDEKIRATVRRDWRYRPYLVNGKPQPVCIALRFIYSQK